MTDPARLPLYILAATAGSVMLAALLLMTVLRRVRFGELAILTLKNLRRNLLRTSLTALAVVVAVFMVSLVWSVLSFMDRVLAEREGMQKAIVTERFQIPSLMPPYYAETLKEGAARPDHPDDTRPTDYMSWAFYGGNIVKEKEQQTRDT